MCAVVTMSFGVCNSMRLSQLFVVTDLLESNKCNYKSKSRLYSLHHVRVLLIISKTEMSNGVYINEQNYS
jgi:hypothetical protein